ncbi:GAF and ANTAR domain-containing protein [Geodermatophilus sp. DSM 45219]|uniref:GAF and ANTAR domain-containing protein n=1 Tax=Geodermatophilus sp. DSM 45219 TaxID=1881103 RepID=UPI00087E1879|nr:GAF and ANTAR domain-containing protein [Geodermatophilus sp. DSM 45219]SDO53370.1 ANTAR domain-containing protein [Geodermatophilus sp. DSM 45219]
MRHDHQGSERPRHDLPLADELSAVSARVAGLLLSEETVDTALGLVSSLALDAVPGAVGAGVSIVDERGRRSSGSTDARVQRADALQYELGEGPCLAAAAGRRMVRVDDLPTDRRWPRWASAVTPLGLRAAMSVPLVAGDASLGALKVYAERPGSFDVSAERRLTLSAAQAAILAANVQTRERARRLTEGLRQAVRERDVVSTAKGVVMAQHGVPEDVAFGILVSRAGEEGAALADVARTVVESAVRRRR